MNKLNIDLEEQKIEVKVNRQKIQMKTYISIAEEMAFTQLCLNYYDKEDYKSVGIIKRIFDLCVLAKLTNIKIDGVSIKENEKKEIEIDIDMSKGNWDALACVGVTSNLLSFIANYSEVWNNVKFAIELKNTRKGFIELGDKIPNFEDMGKVLKESVESVSKLREENKKQFDMALESVTKQKIAKDVKKEVKDKKNKTKNKESD